VREIETDSLGSVFEAEHPRLQRRVAVRTIGANVARDVSFSRRFLLELRSYVALEMDRDPRHGHEPICAACATSGDFRTAALAESTAT